jgi:hypothetical protein
MRRSKARAERRIYAAELGLRRKLSCALASSRAIASLRIFGNLDKVGFVSPTISPHGFWMMLRAKEYFLDFDHFPWFRRASLDQLFSVQLLHEDHLYWPELDVDLDLDRIEHPENYPLVAQTET